MLTEQIVIDQISADEYGNVGIRTRTDILKDGNVIASTFHRRMIIASEPLSKDEDERVKEIVKAARKGAKPLPRET